MKSRRSKTGQETTAMANNAAIRFQTAPEPSTTFAALESLANTGEYNEAILVSAFATVRGVDSIAKVFKAADIRRVHWLIGLDGAVTQPKALSLVTALPITKNAFGWQANDQRPSLHAKVFGFWNVKAFKSALYVGSANLTLGGLFSNVEAGSLSVTSGTNARAAIKDVDKWFSGLAKGAELLTESIIRDYAGRFRPIRRTSRALERTIVGEDGKPDEPTAELTDVASNQAWIQVAVTGGSANQIEICRDMAQFFTGATEGGQVDFVLVHGKTNTAFENNWYRFRSGNTGFRVEVNTDLARLMDLRGADSRRDLVVFTRTNRAGTYQIDLVPFNSRQGQQLYAAADRAGRLRRTTSGPSGRWYALRLD
jgi:hypothetical protein